MRAARLIIAILSLAATCASARAQPPASSVPDPSAGDAKTRLELARRLYGDTRSLDALQADFIVWASEEALRLHTVMTLAYGGWARFAPPGSPNSMPAFGENVRQPQFRNSLRSALESVQSASAGAQIDALSKAHTAHELGAFIAFLESPAEVAANAQRRKRATAWLERADGDAEADIRLDKLDAGGGLPTSFGDLTPQEKAFDKTPEGKAFAQLHPAGESPTSPENWRRVVAIAEADYCGHLSCSGSEHQVFELLKVAYEPAK
jgi:hypothetical protein